MVAEALVRRGGERNWGQSKVTIRAGSAAAQPGHVGGKSLGYPISMAWLLSYASSHRILDLLMMPVPSVSIRWSDTADACVRLCRPRHQSFTAPGQLETPGDFFTAARR